MEIRGTPEDCLKAMREINIDEERIARVERQFEEFGVRLEGVSMKDGELFCIVKPYGLKVWYHGEPNEGLDTLIKSYAAPGISWAQGYDFGEDVRDIAFDFNNFIDRDMAIAELESINGVRTELR